MYLATSQRDLMLNAIDATYGSIHTAFSTSGANEITLGSGSPAYQRALLNFPSSSGGVRSFAPTLPAWNIPGSAGSPITIGWLGLFTAASAGNFRGMAPLGGGTLQPCSMEVSADISVGDILAKAHGFVVGTRCVFWGSALPQGGTPLVVGTIYWVVAATTDSFRVALTSGGTPAYGGTQPYEFWVEKCVPQTYVSQDVYSLSSFSVDLAAVA